ncbi:SHOCT domain-containing protein [Rhodococcus sp. NPDC003322]
MYMYGPGGWGWGYALMLIGMALFWGVLALAVVALIRYAGHNPPPAPPPVSGGAAEQVLAERFARGEIDTAEYQERMQTLRAEQSP